LAFGQQLPNSAMAHKTVSREPERETRDLAKEGRRKMETDSVTAVAATAESLSHAGKGHWRAARDIAEKVPTAGGRS
jgi:hypothetical protein